MRLNKIQKTAVTALEDIKARDITVLDVRKLTSLCDTMIIASAESNRQVKALANHVRDELKEGGATIVGVEGEETGEWVLVDAGDIVVHIMQPAVRAYYNLEELWTPAAKRRAKADRAQPASEALAVARTQPDRPAIAGPMKLRVVALGHRMPAWVTAGWDDYARRMPREFALELVELKPEPRDRGKPVPQLLAAEARADRAPRARARWSSRSTSAASRGRRAQLADSLARWRDDARDVAFVIGSADGLAEAVKRDAAAVVALSALTLPHGARPRHRRRAALPGASACSRGHPYHRE